MRHEISTLTLVSLIRLSANLLPLAVLQLALPPLNLMQSNLLMLSLLPLSLSLSPLTLLSLNLLSLTILPMNLLLLTLLLLTFLQLISHRRPNVLQCICPHCITNCILCLFLNNVCKALLSSTFSRQPLLVILTAHGVLNIYLVDHSNVAS